MDADQDGGVDLLAEVAAASAAAAADKPRRRRDAAIRAALAAGHTYRQVGAAAGLSRPMLDRIRRTPQPNPTTDH